MSAIAPNPIQSGAVVKKWRWKPASSGGATDLQTLDQFTPTILLENSNYEVHFKGSLGWGPDLNSVSLNLFRDSTNIISFRSNSTSSARFDSAIINYVDRPGAGTFTYTLEVEENVLGTADFFSGDLFIEVSKVYVPQRKYLTTSTDNWTWS
jgi:hypothetical protein